MLKERCTAAMVLLQNLGFNHKSRVFDPRGRETYGEANVRALSLFFKKYDSQNRQLARVRNYVPDLRNR